MFFNTNLRLQTPTSIVDINKSEYSIEFYKKDCDFTFLSKHNLDLLKKRKLKKKLNSNLCIKKD